MMKKIVKCVASIGLLAAVSACTVGGDLSSYKTSNGNRSLSADSVQSDYAVTSVNVIVPTSLRVSEVNAIKPAADIVWHGDVTGNRHEQVRAIVARAVRAGADQASGSQNIIADVQVVRFHAQTQKVRYSSYTSYHELEFLVTLRDASTNAVIVPTYKLDATFKAYGGADAVNADRAGVTQEARIVKHLTNVFASEFN